jgi:hypothetical protein
VGGPVTTVVIVAAAVLWVLVALVAAVALGKTIADADRREQPKSCCPHPPEEAPETVRGEFRAIVVPLPAARRGTQLDVRL